MLLFCPVPLVVARAWCATIWSFIVFPNDICTIMLSLQDNGKRSLISHLIGLQPPTAPLPLREKNRHSAKIPPYLPPTPFVDDFITYCFCQFYCFAFLSGTVDDKWRIIYLFSDGSEICFTKTKPECLSMYTENFYLYMITSYIAHTKHPKLLYKSTVI